MKAVAPTLQDLFDQIKTDEVLHAAITEAVHRFYHDKCFSPYTDRPWDTEEVKTISKLHDYLSTKNAGWRHKIQKRQERYDGREPTNALHMSCKP